MSQQKSQSQAKSKKKEPRVWAAFALVALQIIRQQAPSKRAAAQAQSTPQMTEHASKDIAWDPTWPQLPNT